jgi:His/Glu/Gln/Arg/opine family amino acid ABC transporter permease subunit
MADAAVLLSLGDQGYGDELLAGLWLTLRVALLGYASSLLLGLLVGATALSAWLPARLFWRAYASIFMGVPSIVVIFFLYYNGPVLIEGLTGPLGYGDIDVSPYLAGITGLGIVYAAYVGEVLRGAIGNVPHGQFEAAKALALPPFVTWRKVILPQAFRLALPGLVNVWMVLLKDVALVSLVGLADVIRMADIAAGVTKQPFLFYGAAGLLFILIATISTWIAEALERRLRRGLAVARVP